MLLMIQKKKLCTPVRYRTCIFSLKSFYTSKYLITIEKLPKLENLLKDLNVYGTVKGYNNPTLTQQGLTSCCGQLSPALLHLHSLSGNEGAIKQGRKQLSSGLTREEYRSPIAWERTSPEIPQRLLTTRVLQRKIGRPGTRTIELLLGTIFALPQKGILGSLCSLRQAYRT